MNTSIFHLDSNYISFLDSIKIKFKQAQIRAALSVNKELILLYWTIGSELITKQQQFKWGSQFIEQFSHDMQQAFPEMQGFSASNLKRMRRFAQEYPNPAIGSQLETQLPWGHILVLIFKIKNLQQRDETFKHDELIEA